MKKIYFVPAVAALLTLGACDYNEHNFEGLEDLTRPTNVMKKLYIDGCRLCHYCQ